MSLCHAWRKRIPEAFYGELDMKTREKLDRHLAACRPCSDLFREMQETLGAMEVDPTPDPGPEFWEDYWDALVRRMGQEAVTAGPGLSPRRLRPWTRWAFGTVAAAAMLILGVFIGRNLQRIPAGASRPAPTIETATAPAMAEPPLAVRTSQYLKRSKVLLLAVVNFDPGTGDLYGLNPPLQKKTSEELVRQAAVLRKELKHTDPRLERLVSELEMIFLQIANLKAEGDLSEVELIRTGLEQNDILFRINLSELRRTSTKEAARLLEERGGAGKSAASI
jgi:hypothetical protein